ncbi:MAG: DUF6049 family protein [Ilumatobacteraceae bacterium]
MNDGRGRVRNGRSVLLTAATLIVAALLMTVPVLAGAKPAHATGTAQIRLISQTTLVAPGAPITFRLRITGSFDPDTELAIIARDVVTTRGQVRDVIDGSLVPRQRDRVEFVVADLPVTDGTVEVTVPTEVRTTVATELRLRDPGLHPLSVEIREGDNILASMVTFVERGPEVPDPETDETTGNTENTATAADSGDTTSTDTTSADTTSTDTTSTGTGEEPEQPARSAVGVSFLVRVDAAPTLQPNGSTVVTESARAQLDELLDLLELHADVPITVMIRPELLDGLQRSGFDADQTRLERLRAVFAARDELLPATFVALDPTTALDADLGVEFSEQLIAGEDTLRTTLGTVAARSLWVLDGPMDPAALDMLRVLGHKELLVTSNGRSDLPERDGALGAARSPSGTVLDTVSTDLVVQTRISEPSPDPVLAAYHVLADLAAMGIEADTRAEDQGLPPRPLGIAVDLASPGALDPTLLDTLLGLVTSSSRVDPELATANVERLAEDTPTTLRERIALVLPADAQRVPWASELDRLRVAVDSTATMLPDGDVRPARWRSLLQVLPASNLREDRRDAYVAQLDGEMGDVRGQVSVLTPGRVSLGGRVSEVPITLTNSADTPVTVRIRLSSPKLDLLEPDTVVTVDQRLTVDIPVEAKTNGVFPVAIELFTPGGDPVASIGAPVTFTVRATALTGLGQVVSGALVVVLITWWLQHWRSRRRTRRTAQAAAHDAHPSMPVGSR